MPPPAPFTVLFEDNHCLAVAKPARVLTAGDETGDVSLLELARGYLKEKYRKPGDVFLAVVHRLDRPVSGVVLFARTSKGAARLSEQFREGRVRKTYHCVVEAVPSPPEGELEDWLLKDERTNVTTAVAPHTRAAKRATLSYRVLAADRARRHALLEVVPHTGRSHQIRVQLASRGWTIAGDRKYGSTTTLDGSIALHAVELTFEHPTRKEPVTLSTRSPERWSDWFEFAPGSAKP